jgi:urea transport system ATP-binding protein
MSVLVQAARSGPAADGGGPLLQVDAIQAGYGGSQILWGVDLAVARGQVVCLMGRNGVGKTTLLRTVMGLVRARGGRIVLDGADVTRWPTERRAQAGLGYVPQGREIFPHLTVAENLRMALVGCRRASTLDAALEVFPRLRDLLGRKGGVLSGGEQQMLAIGRALLTRPRLLVLDEPTAGIQPSIIDEIEEAIQRIRAQMDVGVLLVEQYVDFAQRLADEYVVMAKGAIVARGDTRELSADTLRHHLSI